MKVSKQVFHKVVLKPLLCLFQKRCFHSRVIAKSGNNEIPRRIHIAIVYEKMGGMDEDQTAFKQLNLSDIKLRRCFPCC